MKFAVWSGTEQKSRRRIVASTKKALLDKIAERCQDSHVVREWHVLKSFIVPNAEWVHGVIEVLGSGLDEKDTKFLGRDYIKPVENSRCQCFFARGKCIDVVPARPIASTNQQDGEDSDES